MIQATAAEATLDDAPCGFFTFDDDGIIGSVNTTLADWLMQPARELEGKHVTHLLAPGATIFYHTHFFPLLKLHGEAREIDLSLRPLAGDRLPVLAHARRQVIDGVPRNDCVVMTMWRRHQFEEQLIAARKAADAAREAKAHFLSMLAHEVRTPLTAIIGIADVFARGLHGPLTAEQLHDVQSIVQAGSYLDALVRDILNYSRAEAVRTTVPVEVVELGEFLARVEAMMRTRWETNALSYSRLGDPDRCHVLADPTHLQQILLNLLSNAAKFTPSGGTVALECTPVGDGRHVTIEVRNSGPGIAAERLEDIFQPFVQIHQPLPDEGQRGAGLGLAISRELARAMDGELTASSVAGTETVFTLKLPAPP